MGLQCSPFTKLALGLTLLVNVFHIDTPPSRSVADCFLVDSTRGGLNSTLRWSPSFNSQYTVERYNVTVTPDPSSCSSDQVSPSDDYSCSGLDTETDYSITVSAINCGDKKGEPVNFKIQTELLGMLSILIMNQIHNLFQIVAFYHSPRAAAEC